MGGSESEGSTAVIAGVGAAANRADIELALIRGGHISEGEGVAVGGDNGAGTELETDGAVLDDPVGGVAALVPAEVNTVVGGVGGIEVVGTRAGGDQLEVDVVDVRIAIGVVATDMCGEEDVVAIAGIAVEIDLMLSPLAVGGDDGIDPNDGGIESGVVADADHDGMLVGGGGTVDAEKHLCLVDRSHGGVDFGQSEPGLVGRAGGRAVVHVHAAAMSGVGGDVGIAGAVVRSVGPAHRSVDAAAGAPVLEVLGEGEVVDSMALSGELVDERPGAGVALSADTADIDIVDGAVVQVAQRDIVRARDTEESTLTVLEAGRTIFNLEFSSGGVDPRDRGTIGSDIAAGDVGRTDTGVEVVDLNIVEIEISVGAVVADAKSDVAIGDTVKCDLERHPGIGDSSGSANSMEGGSILRIGHVANLNGVAVAAVFDVTRDGEGVERSVELRQSQVGEGGAAGIVIHRVVVAGHGVAGGDVRIASAVVAALEPA